MGDHGTVAARRPTLSPDAWAAVLDRVVARAASPGERIRSPYFRSVGGPPSGPWTEAEIAWARAAGGSIEAFEALLAFRGVPVDEWRRSTRDVIIVEGSDRPQWVDDLRALFGPAARRGPPVPRFRIGEIGDHEVLAGLGLDLVDGWSLHSRFEPLLSTAARELATRVAGVAFGVDAPAHRQMMAQLARRWGAAAAVVMHDIASTPASTARRLAMDLDPDLVWFGDDRSAVEQWVALIDTYPVMGRLMAVVYRNWLETIAEVLARLTADEHLLAERFGSGQPLGTLREYAADAGDVHDAGRTVTILTFSSGVRVVYKPKDLCVAGLYMELVDILNEAGLRPRLHRRTVVVRLGYAWEEYIPPMPCQDAAEVRRYYVRMGMHARLFQLLTGLDFTTDNFIAHGEWPVPIDLELLMSARMPPPATASATESTLRLLSWDSPHHSGVITARIIGDSGRRAAEMGALTTVEQRVAPFKQMVVRRGENGVPCITRDYPSLTREVPTPELRGVRPRPAEYFADVERGYRLMGRCLQRVAHRLAAPGGIVDRLASVRVRYLCRDTHIYTRLLQESCHPLRLRDGVEREMCLERLWRARFGESAIVASEVDALRDLDVPLFSARAGGDAITVRGGSEIGGFFDGSPVARVRERLTMLARPDWSREADLIRTALFLLDASARRSPRRGSRRSTVPAGRAAKLDTPDGTPRPAAVDSPRRLARAIADAILRRSVSAAPDQLGWIGVNYLPGADAWGFGPINYDILTGMGGLAVLFADLHQASGCLRYGRAARTLVGLVRRRLVTVSAELVRAATMGEPVRRLNEAAGLHGWGSWLYAGVRAAGAMGDHDAQRELIALIAQIQPATLARCAGADLVSGLAGLLLALVRSACASAGPALWPHVGRVANALLERRDAEGRFPELCAPSDATTLAMLPDAQSGAALALLTVASLRDRSGFVLSATEHRDLVALVAGQCGPDLPTPTAGMVLGQLACAVYAPELRAGAVHSADAHLGAVTAQLTTGEMLAAAEIALAAFTLTGTGRYLERARSLFQARLERWFTERCWFPELYAADRFFHSAIFGTAAVAHLALRLDHPEIASVRVLG